MRPSNSSAPKCEGIGCNKIWNHHITFLLSKLLLFYGSTEYPERLFHHHARIE